VEFRIIEGDGCKDPFLINNWIRLLLQFIERSKDMPFPGDYEPGNPWSSFCWLEPAETFQLLGFDPAQHELSPGLQQTRNWFMARLQKYMSKDIGTGFRQFAYQDLMTMLDRYKEMGVVITPEKHLSPTDLKIALYNDEERV